MKKIYGFISQEGFNGVQGIVVDGDTGEVINSHFCSSVGFAKSDLGFSSPLHLKFCPGSDDLHSTFSFNKKCNEEYREKYPLGYELIWLSNYKDIQPIEELMEKFKNDNAS